MFFLAYLPVLPLKILRICLPQRSYICTTSLDNTNEGRGKGDECMQKKAWIAVVCLLALLTLAGCGKKSQEDVITDLTNQVSDMKGYQMKGEMTLKTSSGDQEYDVEIWHKKPNFYRVSLENEDQDHVQMILRNKEGVYVVTPALNKSYKFQSDWPNQSSQAYLYESLIKDLQEDKEAKLKETEKTYVFETKTNYSNKDSLPTQEIAFKKDSLALESVKIKDTKGNIIVSIVFDEVKFNPSLKEKDFDTEKNMTSMKLNEEELTVSDEPFSVQYPMLEGLEGINLIEEKEVTTDTGVRHVLVYGGEKNFTLIEEKARIESAIAVETVAGEPVDLGLCIGIFTDHMLSWTHNGIQFYLASTDLTAEEMAEVASSFTNAVMK